MKNNVKELIMLEIKSIKRISLPYKDGILRINANTIDIIMFIIIILSNVLSEIFYYTSSRSQVLVVYIVNMETKMGAGAGVEPAVLRL